MAVRADGAANLDPRSVPDGQPAIANITSDALNTAVT